MRIYYRSYSRFFSLIRSLRPLVERLTSALVVNADVSAGSDVSGSLSLHFLGKFSCTMIICTPPPVHSSAMQTDILRTCESCPLFSANFSINSNTGHYLSLVQIYASTNFLDLVNQRALPKKLLKF